MRTIGFYVENYIRGGLERFTGDLVKDLVKDKSNRIIFFHGGDITLPERFPVQAANLEWVYVPVRSTKRWEDHIYALNPPRFLRTFCTAVFDISRFFLAGLNINRCRKAFAAYDLSLLNVVNGGYPAAHSCLSAVVAAKRLSIPKIVLSITGIPQPRRWPLIESGWDRRVRQSVTDAVCVCDYGAERLRRARGFAASQVSTIYCGLMEQVSSVKPMNLEAPRERWALQGKTVIGNLSALERYKGHRFLVQAMGVLSKRFPNLRCLIVGEGKEEKNLNEQIRAEGLESCVFLTGYLENPQTAYALMDIFVHPTCEDAFPYVILEAMTAGKPIVATKVGGIPEQIRSGVSGIIVNPADAPALGEAIASLLVHPDLGIALGCQAQKDVLEKFSAEKMCGEFRKLYDSGVTARA